MRTANAIGRRTSLKILAAGVALGVLPLASSALAQSLSGELTFMVAEYSPKTAPFWEKHVASFEAANPGVDVKLEVVNWQQMHDTTVQRIAAGAMPDLVNTATIWLPEWVDAGGIKEVTPDLISDAVRADIVPSLLELGASYQGKSYGLPIAAAGRGLFFNEDLLKQAGYDAAPTDWAGLKEAITKIQSTTGQFGFGYDAKGVQAFRYFGYFLWNNGGDFFNADGTAAFNSEAGVEALAYLVELAGTNAIPAPAGNQSERRPVPRRHRRNGQSRRWHPVENQYIVYQNALILDPGYVITPHGDRHDAERCSVHPTAALMLG